MKRIDRRILTVLRANHGSAHFLDILRAGGFTFFSTGRIYGALDRMEQAELIGSYSSISGRRVYYLIRPRDTSYWKW